MKLSRFFLPYLLATALFTVPGCAHLQAEPASTLSGSVITGNQLIVAVADSYNTSLAKVYSFSRTSSGWELKSGPVTAMIGRNGFARPGEKREGDGRVPSGIFPLEFAFGYASSIDSRLEYRQATVNDLWVDDVNSPDYNKWVKRGETGAKSFEDMKMSDHRYRHGIVIGYNRNPVVKGNGSGIFAHIWLEEGYTTSGCVAVDENEMVKLLSWLNPGAKPQILMGTMSELAAVKGIPQLPVGTVLPGILEREIRAKVAGNGERKVEYRTRDGFFGIAIKPPKAIEDEMRIKKSWREGCPLPISDLSYLVLSHWGFDGKPKVGELIVDKKLALPVVKAFAELFAARFPIEKMELIEKYDANDDLSMEANNTSAFNCREATGRPGVWSKHSYGGAIDINPLQNPYVSPKNEPLKTMGWDGQEDKGVFLRRSGFDAPSPALKFCTERGDDCLVLPPASAYYRDRKLNLPGMLLSGSREVKAFTDRGIEWWGNYYRVLDYQHFEYVAPKQ